MVFTIDFRGCACKISFWVPRAFASSSEEATSCGEMTDGREHQTAWTKNIYVYNMYYNIVIKCYQYHIYIYIIIYIIISVIIAQPIKYRKQHKRTFSDNASKLDSWACWKVPKT